MARVESVRYPPSELYAQAIKVAREKCGELIPAKSKCIREAIYKFLKKYFEKIYGEGSSLAEIEAKHYAKVITRDILAGMTKPYAVRLEEIVKRLWRHGIPHPPIHAVEAIKGVTWEQTVFEKYIYPNVEEALAPPLLGALEEKGIVFTKLLKQDVEPPKLIRIVSDTMVHYVFRKTYHRKYRGICRSKFQIALSEPQFFLIVHGVKYRMPQGLTVIPFEWLLEVIEATAYELAEGRIPAEDVIKKAYSMWVDWAGRYIRDPLMRARALFVLGKVFEMLPRARVRYHKDIMALKPVTVDVDEHEYLTVTRPKRLIENARKLWNIDRKLGVYYLAANGGVYRTLGLTVFQTTEPIWKQIVMRMMHDKALKLAEPVKLLFTIEKVTDPKSTTLLKWLGVEPRPYRFTARVLGHPVVQFFGETLYIANPEHPLAAKLKEALRRI